MSMHNKYGKVSDRGGGESAAAADVAADRRVIFVNRTVNFDESSL